MTPTTETLLSLARLSLARPGHAEDLLRQAVQMIDAGIAIDASFRWVETARALAQAEADPERARAAIEILGYVVVDRDGKLYRYQDGEPGHLYRPRERDIAESFCGSLNRAGDGPIGPRSPWRVAPVGPVVDLKSFGAGIVDKDGAPLASLTFATAGGARRSAAAMNSEAARVPSLRETYLSGAPYAAVTTYFVPPPDRPAEAVELDPRADRWAAIPKVGKP